MDIKEFAQKFIKAEDEAFQNGNFDALEALEDPNAVYHSAATPDLMGWEAHKQYILGARQAFSDYQQEYKYLTGEGNLFVLSYKMSGMFTGEIPGFPPHTGKEVTADGLFVFRVENDKIVEVWARSIMTGLE